MSKEKQNKLEAAYEKLRIYKKQINELQRALELQKSIANTFHFESAYYREVYQQEKFSTYVPKKVKEEIIEDMRQHFSRYGYELRKKS